MKKNHAYSDDPWNMCGLKIPKRISLFNRQIDTLLKLVKSIYTYLPWQYKYFYVHICTHMSAIHSDSARVLIVARIVTVLLIMNAFL